MEKIKNVPEVRFPGFTDLPAGRQALGNSHGGQAWCVYALECDDKSIYKGMTNDLLRRITEHMKGQGAEHTKKHKPVRLVYFEKCTSEENAHERELYLKSGSGREWLKNNMQKYLPLDYSRKLEYDYYAWEQRKWIDTVDISTEMVNPTSGEYDDMPHIAPGNIESFTGRILDNVKTVKEEQLISGKFRFRPDDVVYGKINPQLGKYFYASVDGLTSADAYVFNGKNGLTQKFLFSLIQTDHFFKYSISVSKRSGMPKINRDELNAYSFLMPSEQEQEKIGGFLLQLDHLITLHHREGEQLQKVKKTMLQKMFPRNGESFPEVRFPGFTDAWEQRKLETVATFSKGSGYSKGDLQEDGTPIILYGRLYTKYETIISEVDTFVSEKSGSVYSKGGEVIVPASGETAEDIARAATVENKGILLGGDLNVVTPNEDVDSAFLALSISNGAAHKELASKAQGKSVVHIHNAEIQALNIAFPSKPEQSRISGYFAKLDTLITLHQREGEQLQKLKKTMLQKMFPACRQTGLGIRNSERR